MLKIALCVLVLGSVVGFASCSSDNLNSGSCPAGGQTASGGRGGSGAAGGQGGTTVVRSWKQLPCITTLLSQCPLEGSCRKQTLDGGDDFQACHACGVTVSATIVRCTMAVGAPPSVYEVRREDGSLCFAQEVYLAPSCEMARFVVRNAAGELVAEGMNGNSLACAGGGPTCQGTGGVGATGADCRVPVDGYDCAPGSCP